MRHLLLPLAAIALLAAPTAAQTVKVLAYDTNGRVIAATNVTWTNAFGFSTNTVAAQVRSNLLLPAAFLTNTNAANLNAALGLASAPDEGGYAVNSANVLWDPADGGNVGLYVSDGDPMFGPFGAGPWRTALGLALSALTNTSNSAFRSAIGLQLAALTNTSNVTAMRALSGSTNTNTPYSGSVSLTNTNTLVFSNGILQSVQ
jgi:hypothetical protein